MEEGRENGSFLHLPLAPAPGLDSQRNTSEEEIVRHQSVSVWSAAFVVPSRAIFPRLNRLTGSFKAGPLDRFYIQFRFNRGAYAAN